MLLMDRELKRSHASLRFEEHQNRKLPRLEKANTVAQFDKLMEEGHQELIKFFGEQEIITMKDYMEPALRAQIPTFTPSDDIRGFFYEIHYRDPMPLSCHFFHWT